MRSTFFLVLLLLCCLSPGYSQQSTTPAAIFSSAADTYIKKLLSTFPALPGLAVVVVKDDKPVFMKTYGWADKEKGIKSDEHTLYYIASATKSFTGIAAAQLDHEGGLKLDATIQDVAPGISFKHAVPANMITIRQLLTHTSGIQNDPLTFRMAYSGTVDKKDMREILANESILVDSLRGKYFYDNLGYNIYTVLLWESLHKNWQDLVQEKIFTPLGMNHSTAYLSKATANNWTVAAPYLVADDKGLTRSWLPKQDNNLQSAGGIFCSINDASKWLRMNMAGGKLDGKQVIPSTVVEACHQGYVATVRDLEPFTGNGMYGIGWQIGNYKQERVIYHFGGFPGYRSHISFMPDQKLGLAIFVNESSVGGRVASLLATFSYDWWLQMRADFDAYYQQQLKDLSIVYVRNKKARQDEHFIRAQRSSQLSRSINLYTGQFSHPAYGVIEVSEAGHDLRVSMGNMQCIATAYIRPETVRIELVPGTGEPLAFKIGPDGTISSVLFRQLEFSKLTK
ncbi:serine hydrolase domain-containing protein [Paraflavitalea sp. CAU 1676]|uniref:serine hydrolase domain-containing protein n=1 Tax=Paraflavitalea sp. CAU 1676 TaxID=3032598 RepID=UPI0023DC0246|nr:serine hydrolase domain-containing protein [Paraflavitalea sp. CAU 1676]MDF2187354.1 serine hydrolase [Paraflavitalea sp. CAU 1676]